MEGLKQRGSVHYHVACSGISAPAFQQNRQLAAALTLAMQTHRYSELYLEQAMKTGKALSTGMPSQCHDKALAMVWFSSLSQHGDLSHVYQCGKLKQHGMPHLNDICHLSRIELLPQVSDECRWKETLRSYIKGFFPVPG